MPKYGEPPKIRDSALELRVYATLRSGHNGIMRWLVGHFSGDILQRYAGTGPANQYIYWEAAQNPAPPKRNLYMFNVENADLSTVRAQIADDVWKTRQGKADRTHELIIIRDPYNCFASTWKLMGAEFTKDSMVRYWKQHAREVLEPRHVEGAIPCLFDRWMYEPKYRVDLSTALGLNFTDRGYGMIGQKSSFDVHLDSPKDMDLLGRWKHFKDDPEFRAVFDDEIRDLANHLFGEWAEKVGAALR